MKRALVAILAAMVVSATPLVAVAQAPMGTELSMLEQAVHNQFGKLGISEYQMEDLTLGQLAEIKQVVGSSDYGDNEKKNQIMQIIERGTN